MFLTSFDKMGQVSDMHFEKARKSTDSVKCFRLVQMLWSPIYILG